MFLASQGRPRVVNQLGLQLLIQAAVEGRDHIDAEFVGGQIAAHPLYDVSGNASLAGWDTRLVGVPSPSTPRPDD